MVMCLCQGADLHMAPLMPLPLTISCSSKSRLVLPSWFYLSGACRMVPEKSKRAVKWLSACECVCKKTTMCKHDVIHKTRSI